jgi:hypothetical protein
MRPPETLFTYPYVIVRLRCERCQRHGGYRLTRLILKFGPNITMDELLMRLTADCPWWEDRGRGALGCRARYCDLDPPRRPPDLPPALRMRVIKGGKNR